MIYATNLPWKPPWDINFQKMLECQYSQQWDSEDTYKSSQKNRKPFNYSFDSSICIEYDSVDHIIAEEQIKSFWRCSRITWLFVHDVFRTSTTKICISNSIPIDVGDFSCVCIIKCEIHLYTCIKIVTFVKTFVQVFEFLLSRWFCYLFYILSPTSKIFNKFTLIMNIFFATFIIRVITGTKITLNIIISCKLVSSFSTSSTVLQLSFRPWRHFLLFCLVREKYRWT